MQFGVVAGFCVVDRPLNAGDVGSNGWPMIRRKDNNREEPPAKILLVSNVFVRGQKDMEQGIRFPKQFSILYPTPPHLLRSSKIMTAQRAKQRFW
jgi:hypothetical protein